MSAFKLCEWQTRDGGKMRLVKFAELSRTPTEWARRLALADLGCDALIERLGTDALGGEAWRRISPGEYPIAVDRLAWAIVRGLFWAPGIGEVQAWAKANGEDKI